jgi:hypothetical protein
MSLQPPLRSRGLPRSCPECSLSYPVCLTEVVRLFRLWRYARGTSLLAVVMVCCVGAFLCLLPTELDASAALTTPHLLSPDQGANQGYLAVPQEEAGDADERPANADLLSVLLFVVCFGAIVGWMLAYGQEQRAFRFAGLDHRPTFGTALNLKDRSFLGVFRL